MTIPNFSALEQALVQQALDERWGKDKVQAEEVEVELRLSQDDRTITPCPAVYWQQDACHFVIAKTGESHYRSQFFYSVLDQYGTGIEEYTNLEDCVLYLLRLQADHASERQKTFPTKQ